MSFFQKILTGFFCLALLFFTQSVFAQKKLKSGVVVYEITEIETSVPELKLMKGTKTSLYFSPEKQKIDISLNNESIRFQTFYNNRSDDVTVLYNFMGQQFKVNSNNKNSPKAKSSIKKISHEPTITKSIAGYSCHQVELSFEDEKIVLWVTDKIKAKNPDFQNLFPGLEGFPLEYVRRGENTKMTFKATIISEILPAGAFDTPDAYQEISEEEFNERMGGMKFGF